MRLPFRRNWQSWIADRRSRRDLEALLQFLDGKSVAIVGNARSLLDHRYGARIDEHEIVTRMNIGFPIDPAAQGTRCDLWCFSGYRVMPSVPKGFDPYYRVWMSPKYRNLADHSVNCHFYPMSSWRRLQRQLGARPSVGAMTIDLISNAAPRQVTIVGFDFNRSKSFYEDRNQPAQHDFAAEARCVKEVIARRSWRFIEI